MASPNRSYAQLTRDLYPSGYTWTLDDDIALHTRLLAMEIHNARSYRHSHPDWAALHLKYAKVERMILKALTAKSQAPEPTPGVKTALAYGQADLGVTYE